MPNRANASTAEALWDWDLTADRMHVSPSWCALVGAEAHIGTSPDGWLGRVHPDDLPAVLQALDTLRAGKAGNFDLPHRLRHTSGSYRWTSCRATVRRRDAAGRPVRLGGVHVDVTATVLTDPQTGLPNRLLLDEHLTRSIDRAHRYGFHYALVLLDLSRTAAHIPPADVAAVNPLLAAVARRVETCVRSADQPRGMRHDDLVARLDGDRFAILLDGLKDVRDVLAVADRVLIELRSPLTVRSSEVFVAATLGIAISATGYTDPGQVVRDAEIALHRAQLLGGSRAEVFDTAVLHAAQAELQLEDEFAGALERGEFRVYFQPIVAIASMRVVGFEALARWQHPVLGLVAPADFIPLAERTGFIVPLGRWVLREACAQLAAWRQQRPDDALWMSVNVSSAQVEHPTLVGDVEAALAVASLDPPHLVLEITESLAAERPGAAKSALMRLRALGVRLGVDDFGAGHSSLASLRDLPVDVLKMDRSFVRGVDRRSDAPEIVRTVLAMARQLGLQLVAEGIETDAQLAVMRSLGCEFGQGYVFAAPLDPERASGVLLEGRFRPADAAGTRRSPDGTGGVADACRPGGHPRSPACRCGRRAACLNPPYQATAAGGPAAGLSRT